MGFFNRIKEKSKQKAEQRNIACQSLINTAVSAINEMDSFLASSDDFLDLRQCEWILSKTAGFRASVSLPIERKLRKATNYRLLLTVQKDFIQKSAVFQQSVLQHNERVAQRKLAEAYKLVRNVEGRVLDKQQMLCILKEAHSHLVIAGAGTGKTTTIIGKIVFLLRKGLCEPKDILALSFTNASATEMRDRIQRETNQLIEASTFHKLGLNIIKSVDGITPKITQISLRSFSKEQLSDLMKQPDYRQLLSSYLLYHGVDAKSEFEFSSETEYREYLEQNPPTTLKGERVKSYGELDIANFLYQNGIAYKYEAAYPVDTRTSEYGQYYPDFFLPDCNIYIEYFGINKKGEVPSYFRGRHGKSAAQTYHESMEWKRKLHAERGTILIECYAYEKFSGTFLANLEIQLKEYQVSFIPKDIWNELTASDTSLLDGFAELAGTVIALIKNNDYSVAQVRELAALRGVNIPASLTLLTLIEPIYESYCNTLSQCGEIDFNDMINTATKYVQDGKYLHEYKYVIVDEYQDISRSRFLLLKVMRTAKDYNLFCVGDDWQSIYRFVGSDIGYILNFSQYWGASEISRIETTYRFPQTLIDISSRFVMRNPNQVKKSIRSNNEELSFPLGEIVGYTEQNLADFISTRLLDLPQSSSVFFLGRYNSDKDYIKKNSNFSFSYDNESGQTNISFSRRRDLKITFLTIHRSKGLQADYIFVLNNKKSRMGFPSKIQNAPLLDLLFENSDTYLYAEERRLFYVALTRAKKKVILLSLEGKESEFVTELHTVYGDKMKNEAFTCPQCGGRLVKRAGPYGEFFGCSNYRTQGCKYTRQISKKMQY
jgi:DNA helicase-4